MSERIVCDNCDWAGTEDELEPAGDLWNRMEPGDIMPNGECPECGALCFEDTEPMRAANHITELIAALKALHSSQRTFSGSYGWGQLDEDARAAAEKVLAKIEKS